MDERSFLITGCGRSGTGYAAALLNRLGIPCGHEALSPPEALGPEGAPCWPAGVFGESSWLAAPFVPSLPAGTLVLHQVRHPLAVARSLWRTRFFEGRHAWREFAVRHVPELAEGPPLASCFLYWLRWNELVDRARDLPEVRVLRHRLEDLDEDTVLGLCTAIGRPRTRDEVVDALAEVSRKTNTSGDASRDGDVGWEAFADHSAAEQLRALAKSYGYEDLDVTQAA